MTEKESRTQLERAADWFEVKRVGMYTLYMVYYFYTNPYMGVKLSILFIISIDFIWVAPRLHLNRTHCSMSRWIYCICGVFTSNNPHMCDAPGLIIHQWWVVSNLLSHKQVDHVKNKHDAPGLTSLLWRFVRSCEIFHQRISILKEEMTHQGIEPWTYWLWVSCSAKTKWATIK